MEGNKSYRLTPEVIAEKRIQFRIPLYQRLFAWKPEDVEQLMEDLKNHFNKHPDDSKPYYLGMLTVVNQEGCLDLIDGQQRITVLALMSISFMRALENIDNKLSLKWKKVLCDLNGIPRIIFNGRSDDYKFLIKLVNNEESSYINQKMLDGLLIIEEFLNNNFKDADSLKIFALQVFENLVYFIAELPEHYVENHTSLNEYFEAMNSNGKALEQHEILKVSLLADQPDSQKITFTKLWNRVSNFNKPLIPTVENRKDPSQNIGVEKQNLYYKEYIEDCRRGKFEEVINKLSLVSDKQYSISIANIPIEKKEEGKFESNDKEDSILSFAKFLLIVLAIHNEEDPIARQNPSKLLQMFKDNPPKDLKKFYYQLLMFRLILDMYIIRIENTSGGGIHTLIAKDERDLEFIHKSNKRVRQYQALLDVSTELHIWLLPLLKIISQRELTQSEILQKLIEIDKSNGHQYCPELKDLDFGNRNRSRYWFWRLDYAIWEKQLLAKDDENVFAEFGFSDNAIDKQAILEYVFRENRSIEHLHPQEQSKQPEKWETREINRFGNLAMISSSFNSEQRNWLVVSKLENIKPQIENKSLQSLKLYFMYLQAKKDGGWKQGENGSMQTHEKVIYKLLLESIQKYENGVI